MLFQVESVQPRRTTTLKPVEKQSPLVKQTSVAVLQQADTAAEALQGLRAISGEPSG